MIYNPTQPLAKDEHGTLRFQQNAIVRYLLDVGPFDMNHLARGDFSDADRVQFAQLIGYSLSGFGELSYVDDAAYQRASMAARIGDAGGELPMPTTRTMNEFEANLLDALRMFLQSEL
jgi:hypothetical protein